MKILTANIALGLPEMDHVIPVVKGHLAFHGRTMVRMFLHPRSLKEVQAYSSPRRVEYLKHHVDLRKTMNLIERVGADLIILNEILPQFHRNILEPHLERLGYRTRVWGESMHYPDATVTTLVASKISGVPAAVDLSWESHAGGGAGVAGIRLENSSVTVIGLHLGVADKFPWLYKAEIEGLARFIVEEQRAGREVIVAGDWNASAASIQRFQSFSKLGLINAEGDIPTCPTFLPWLKPLDHIFVPATWRTARIETIAFGSDHLALLVECTMNS